MANSEIAQELEAIINETSYEGESHSVIGDILLSILNETEYTGEADSVIAKLLLDLKAKIEQGGGEAFVPTFTKTTLCDNSELSTGNLTLSDDYDNYDLLYIELWNTSYNRLTTIITTPEILADIGTYSSGKINFNECGNNQYANYTFATKTSLTKNGARNCLIKKIEGWTGDNCNIVKADLYQKKAITNETVSITSETSLYEYDYIVMSACDGDSTETQPCVYLAKPTSEDLLNKALANMFNYYATTSALEITEFTMSANRYFYVQGLKLEKK